MAFDLTEFAEKIGGDMMKAQTLSAGMKPGVFPGLPIADYLRLAAFSASVASDLVDFCPRAAFHSSYLNNSPREADDTAASDAGTIAHAILLEGSTDGVAVIDPNDHPAEKTGAIPAGWTNKSIRAARDAARAAGKIPVLADAMGRIEAMVDSGHAFIESLRDTEPAVWQMFQPGDGESELTCVWDDDGTLCRMRPDRINPERTVIVDLKFTALSAEPDAFSRGPMARHRISAAFYRRGCQQLFGTSPDYLFLVIENSAPFLCSLVGVDPTGFQIGGEKVAYALNEWRRCLASGEWPGYPTRVCYPETPIWEQNRWQEKLGVECDAQGIPYSIDKLFERKRESA